MPSGSVRGRGRAAASARSGIALLLAPLAVAGTHLGLGYTLASLHCHIGFLSFELLTFTAIRVALVAVTAMALISVLLLAGWGLLLLSRTRRAGSDAADDRVGGAEEGAVSFLLVVALLLDALAVLYLVWSVNPVLSVRLC